MDDREFVCQTKGSSRCKELKAFVTKEGSSFCMWCGLAVEKRPAREFEPDFTNGGILGKNRKEF